MGDRYHRMEVDLLYGGVDVVLRRLRTDLLHTLADGIYIADSDAPRVVEAVVFDLP